MAGKSIFKEAVKTSGIYSVGQFAARGVGFLMLPVYTRFLTPANYGVLELLELTRGVIATLFDLRIASALFYFHEKAKTPGRQLEILRTALIGAALVGAVGGTICWFASPALSRLVFGTGDYATHLRIALTAAAVSLPFSVGLSSFRARNEAVQFVSITIVHLLTQVSLSVVFLAVFKLGVFALLLSPLITSSAILLFFVGKFFRSSSPRDWFQPPSFLKIIRYAAPIGLGGLPLYALHYGDRYFLRSYTSLEAIGIYSLAYKFGMLISYFLGPFSTYWYSQMYSIVRRPDGEMIYVRVLSYITAGASYLALLIGLFINPVLAVAVPESFRGAASLAPWIAAAYAMRTVADNVRAAFLLTGRTREELWVTLSTSSFCMVAYAILIPRYQLEGAVASTVLSFTVMLALSFWRAQSVRRFPLEYRRMIAAAGLAITLRVVFSLIRSGSLWLDSAYAVILAASFPVVLTKFNFFHEDEIKKLRELPGALRWRLSATMVRLRS